MADEGETTSGADAGTYTLVVAFDGPTTVEVGALGSIEFDANWYAYTGSAFGPGGFARVERHRDLAAGERDARHWHVDYLLGHPAAGIEHVVRTVDADIECAVARALAAEFDCVPAFGASDCGCVSHLVGAPDRDLLVKSVERAHETAVEREDEL